jgi:phosphoserine phosphatase
MIVSQSYTHIPVLTAVLLTSCAPDPPSVTVSPLKSWKDTASKRAILTFVKKVTTEGSPEFVPRPERVAVFDNDGTLWSEKPLPVQVVFLIDRVKALAPQHPEWRNREPFSSVMKGDIQAVTATGEKGVLELIAATHAGMTTDEFTASVQDWIASAEHPKTRRLYIDMIYQPMLELLAYLRSNGFKTFIVSGGGVEFMRPWTERVYGIPPEQVVGSAVKLKLEMRAGKPILLKLPQVDIIDDKEGKPVAMHSRIGRRPVAAFGNSDGDMQMLEWTMAGSGARFALLVHHDDADREYAYDRDDKLQQLDTALDAANARGWTVVSMKNDWTTVYPAAEDRVSSKD